MASSIIPTIPVPVKVLSPNLVVYPPVEAVVLKSAGYGVSGSQTLTTSGSAQLLADIPIAALGIDLLTSPKALLTLETAQDLSGTMLGQIGCAFAVCPDSNLSNVTSVSRDYLTSLDPSYFTTSSSLVLTQEADYPAGTTNVSIYVTAPVTLGYNLTTSNVMNYSYSLVSLA